MAEGPTCPTCGARLPAGTPGGSGSCPACLLRLGLEVDADTAATGLGSAPERIGPYEILEQIGEGGMGEVYLAEQRRPLRRRVALKIIKLGMNTREVIARFESERQALALMNHPNIAAVIDAGEHEGRPYFVMEYVAGIPITAYCDRHRLRTRERLDLFVLVCQAIQHAHQKGVIHRDVKPSNVLVAVHDGRPVPKVIDFGVAKAISQRLTEKTLFTQHGLLVGTPEYMSPEQTDLIGRDIDTGTDIYSLGVLLYELLTGGMPFDPKMLREAGYDEMRRIIREQEPVKPATWLDSLGDSAETIAEHRRTDIKALGRQIRGDLEWITLKALEKDRTRRYATASEFAADIVRHLNDDPVMAGPPSRRYRVERFVRKHRGPVIAAGAVALAVLLAGSVAVWFGISAQRSERVANSAVAQYQTQLRVDESLRMAALAAGELERGRPDRAVLLALNGLPGRYGGDRPWLPQVEAVLAKARGALQEKLVMRHEGRIGSAVLSPDATKVLTASDDGTAVVWDVETGAKVATFAHTGPVLQAAFGTDGTRVTTVASEADGRAITIAVWDVASGARLSDSRHDVPRWERTLSPNGLTLAIRGDDANIVVLQEAATGATVATLTHDAAVDYAMFNADGSELSTYLYDGEFLSVITWRIEDGQQIGTMRNTGGVAEIATAIATDGGKIAAALPDDSVLIWDAATGSRVSPLGHGAPVRALAFDANGRRLLSTFKDHTAVVLDLASATIVATLSHDDNVSSARFSRNSQRVVTASGDGTAVVWDAASGARIASLTPGGGVAQADFAHDGQQVVTLSGGRTRSLTVWDLETTSRVATLDTDLSDAYAHYLALTPDGERALVAGLDGKAEVFDLPNQTKIATLNQDEYAVKASFSPDSRQVLSFSESGTAILWAIQARTDSFALVHDRKIDHLAFSANGNRLVASVQGGAAAVWDLSNGARIRNFDDAGGYKLMPFLSGSGPILNTDGTRVVTTGEDGTTAVWDVTSGARIATFNRGGEIHSTSLNAEGTRLATASNGGTVVVWEVASGDRVATFRHDGPVWSVSFARDGSRLATASEDGTAAVWDSDSGTRVASFDAGGAVLDARLSDDGRTLYTRSVRKNFLFLDDTLIAWDVGSGARVSTLTYGDLSMTSLSPDGQRVAISSVREGATSVRDTRSGAMVATFRSEGALRQPAFSPDGKRLAIAAVQEGATTLWDIESGVELASFSHDGMTTFMLFSPDGSKLATAFDDGTVEVLDILSGTALIDAAIARLPLNRTCLTPEERRTFFLPDLTAEQWAERGCAQFAQRPAEIDPGD